MPPMEARSPRLELRFRSRHLALRQSKLLMTPGELSVISIQSVLAGAVIVVVVPAVVDCVVLAVVVVVVLVVIEEEGQSLTSATVAVS